MPHTLIFDKLPCASGFGVISEFIYADISEVFVVLLVKAKIKKGKLSAGLSLIAREYAS
ncbi:hypothetical protein [Francisella-like endosymbiont]|uniref:hypothetical protein n=1 Tax=Francisella-like endosymbiont TaxID=512373 RepID=UPI00296E896A